MTAAPIDAYLATLLADQRDALPDDLLEKMVRARMTDVSV